MYIEQTNSTNTLMQTLLPQEEFFTIWTDNQTAGRGQAGNGWEAEPGKNLTFSVLLRPDDIEAGALFRLSMLVPLAIVRVLNEQVTLPEPATIKWPNDIYVGDKKICGILIENILSHQARYSIVGIGLNVNQRVFVSNAPNPSSLALLTGQEYDREVLLEAIVAQTRSLRPWLQEPERLKKEYMQYLYRREGWYPYVEREVSTAPTMIVQREECTPRGLVQSEQFMARIVDVEDDGHLVLQTEDSQEHRYHFKQIRYVI